MANKGTSKYNKDSIIAIASVCENITIFRKNYPREYRHAYRQGWLNELIDAAGKPTKRKSKYNLSSVLNLAGTCINTSDFSKKYPREYVWLCRQGYIKLLNELLPKIKKFPELNKEQIFNVARQCVDIGEFRKKYHQYYRWILANKLLSELKEICTDTFFFPIKEDKSIYFKTYFLPSIGDKFKAYTIVNNIPFRNKNNRIVWKVQCECGKYKELTKYQLEHPTEYLRCKHITNKFKQGDICDWWTVINAEMDEKYRILVKCKCGVEKRISIFSLNTINSRSCGCYNRMIVKQINSKPDGESARTGLWHAYRKGAKTRSHDFSLSLDTFFELTKQNCFYCGQTPNKKWLKHNKSGTFSFCIYNGVDRVDNLKGYDASNCVSCCKSCNLKKGSIEIDMCSKINNYFNTPENLCDKRQELSMNFKKVCLEVFSTYKLKCKKYGIKLGLDFLEFASLLKKNCFYCHKRPSNQINGIKYNGIDRVNNSQGYTSLNSVPCCRSCNRKKGGATPIIIQKILSFTSM